MKLLQNHLRCLRCGILGVFVQVIETEIDTLRFHADNFWHYGGSYVMVKCQIVACDARVPVRGCQMKWQPWKSGDTMGCHGWELHYQWHCNPFKITRETCFSCNKSNGRDTVSFLVCDLKYFVKWSKLLKLYSWFAYGTLFKPEPLVWHQSYKQTQLLDYEMTSRCFTTITTHQQRTA